MITHEFTSKTFQLEKLGQSLSRLVFCVIHLIAIMVLKSVNRHAAGNARAVSSDQGAAQFVAVQQPRGTLPVSYHRIKWDPVITGFSDSQQKVWPPADSENMQSNTYFICARNSH